MQIKANSQEEYIDKLNEDRRMGFKKLRETINKNLTEGFSEKMINGVICYIVPHSIYPPGDQSNPKEPLIVLSIATQKHFIAIYMCIFEINPLLEWFKDEYKKRYKTKLDMGKSCIRFNNFNNIPYEIISEFISKLNTKELIGFYEEQNKK